MPNAEHRYVKTQIRVPIHIKDKLDEIAKKENRAFNNLTSTILINYVESLNDKKRA